MEKKTLCITEGDIKREEELLLLSPNNPSPIQTLFLSNIDQTVAFPVETTYFYKAPQNGKASASDIVERVKTSVSQVLLIPYYFMAGRLSFNPQSKRLELVCNNAGVHFVSASTDLTLQQLGNVSLPNPSFQHLLLRTDAFGSLEKTPLFTIQVTTFKCGALSLGFVVNHSILDGRSAFEFLDNLASICRREGLKTQVRLNGDRTCLKARNPPQIHYPHQEYSQITEVSSLNSSSFTSSGNPAQPPSRLKLQENQSHELFHFAPSLLHTLKKKASTKCSTFEALVAHIWRARTRAVFDDPAQLSSVLFAVDIRAKLSPPVPQGFVGNAVITACATAQVRDLEEKPLSFCIEKVKEAIEGISDEYVRSAIDWLEVNKGVPSTCNGGFYISAWWRLPLYELDFGYGKPVYAGPVVSGMDEFVLLLSDGKKMEEAGGIHVLMILEEKKMERLMDTVFEI